MKIVLTVIAALMMLCGLLWMGQGSGVIAWPANSFMIDQRPWITRGAILAIFGALVFWLTRRR